ncbi:DUF3307 domain-containing protein [Brevibacillus centrosporus]|uniref:DUF3307 domain-containing protein n=1 Tax=Brevibacillus centrosporus TaxID=54910 RepID=UPI000B83B7D3
MLISVNVELFIILYVAHKVADYLFQTDGQARFKSEDWGFLLRHCIVYTITVLGFAYLVIGYFSVAATILIFFSHLILDKRDFLNWWAVHIKRIKDPNSQHVSTVMLELDQAFHYIVLLIISLK